MRIVLSIILIFSISLSKAQIILSQKFNTLSLTSYTSGNLVNSYTFVPSGFSVIDDNYPNNIGTSPNYNAPFQVPELKNKGWIVAFNPLENDTFLISTSWLDNAAQVSDEWVITPSVTIQANTILSWRAKSPDGNNRDGYEVYGTNKSGSLTANDFTIGDKLFSILSSSVLGSGENTEWTKRSIFLGSFQGQTLRFAFRNNSLDKFQLWIDDIEVNNLTYLKDAALSEIRMNKYFLSQTAQNITLAVKNTGAINISSLTLNYKYGNSSVVSQSFALTSSLTSQQSATFSFPQTLSVTSPGLYEVKAWISLVNGSADENLVNDTLKMNITVMNSAPPKTVLMEQFVSANDPESPDAQERALSMQALGGVVVNIHHNDQLTEPATATLVNTFMKNSSTSLFDRAFQYDINSTAVNRTSYYDKLLAEGVKVSPVKVSLENINYSTITKALSFLAKAEFYGDVKGDYKLGVYLVENHVCGNKTNTLVNGYNQLSNYYNVPWSPYYLSGYYSLPQNAWVLDAWRFKHENVLIHAFDGTDGLGGLITPSVSTGEIFSKLYVYSVPTPTGISKYNPDNMHIVAFVYDNDAIGNKKKILNVVREKVTTNSEVIGIDEIPNLLGAKIFPNPVSESVFIQSNDNLENVELSIQDLTGRIVFSTRVNSGKKDLKLNLMHLEEGVYLLNLVKGSEKSTTKLIKVKAN
ncbi:MAG: Omp28-related outer membrane protein [Sphingobacteriaceae bacterium]|nr:Omp28-related outer membrane protein [Sphingobacteriaceae bacterium]